MFISTPMSTKSRTPPTTLATTFLAGVLFLFACHWTSQPPQDVGKPRGSKRQR